MCISLPRGLSALACATLICTAALGCSGGQSTPGPSKRVSAAKTSAATNLSPGRRAKLDSDGDSDYNRNHDDDHVKRFGHAAIAAERRAIVTVIERYYAATSTKDGNTACTLLTAFLAKGIAEQARAGKGAGERCGVAVSETLKHLAGHTDADQARIDVTTVRVHRDHARAVVRSATGEERYVPLTRQGQAWKVASLYDVLLE